MNARHKLEMKMTPSWHESSKEDSIRSDENYVERSVWTRQGDQFQQRFEQQIEAYGGTRNRSEEIRNKFHEHRNVNKEFHSWTYLNSNHQLFLIKKNMKIPAAKTALHQKKRSKLNILSVWNEAKTKNKHEVINEVQTIFTIHEPIHKSTRPQEQFVITTSTIEWQHSRDFVPITEHDKKLTDMCWTCFVKHLLIKIENCFENRTTIIHPTSYKKPSTCWLGDWMKLRTSHQSKDVRTKTEKNQTHVTKTRETWRSSRHPATSPPSPA